MEIELLYTCGDSWTRASEYPAEIQDKVSWPTYLQGFLGQGTNLVNLSAGGASNDYMVRKTVDFFENETFYSPDKQFAIIGWTAHTREELKTVLESRDWPSINLSYEDPDPRIRKYQELMLEWGYNEECWKNHLKRLKILLGRYLEDKNIKYIFFDNWEENVWDTYSRRGIHVPYTFSEFINKSDLDFLPGGHPTAKSNYEWADHLHFLIKTNF